MARAHPAQELASRVGLGILCLALVAGCTSSADSPSTPAPIETATSSAAPAASGLKPAVAAGPIAMSSGDGPVIPESWPSAVLTGAGLSVSTSPFLRPKVDASGEIRYEIYDVSAGQEPGTSTPLISATGGRSWQVPRGTLTDGRQYAWRAMADSGGEWVGPYIVDVDATRPSLAPRDQFAGVSTHLMTGVPMVTWSSRSFPTVRGAALAVLDYSPTQVGDAGLPRGWRMAVPLASRWTTFEPAEGDDPASVYIADVDGRSMTFTRNDAGVYAQTWANGRRIGTASSGVLQRAGDTWRLIEVSGDITEFRGNRPVAFYRGGTLTGTIEWDADGRLVSATDPSGRAITFGYGAQACPTAEGFVDAPDGILCSISWWDGTQTQIAYVDAPNGPQVGLIADAVGGPGPMSEIGLALGWDAAGRLAAVRSPLVNAAVAAGLVDRDAVDVLTQITYDDQGRVKAVASPAPEPGAERLVHSYRYPVIREEEAADDALATASVAAGVIAGGLTSGTQPEELDSEIGNGVAYQMIARASDWRPVERVDRDGARTRMTWDEQGRRVESVVDYEGRVTTFDYADERRSGFTGPSTDSGEAFQQKTKTDEDASGAPLRGLTAYYWGSGAGEGPLASGGWIARDGRLVQSWDTSPTGSAPWSGMFTGTWTTKTGKDGAVSWLLEVSASGARVDVYVDNRPCELDSRDRCRLQLRDGRHFLRIDLSSEKQTASLSVSGDAVEGEPSSSLPTLTDITPDFGLTTTLTTNDRFADGETVSTRTEYADPWTGSPTSIESPGGLVSTASYEPTGAAGWGRRISSTTPAGLTSTTDYWPLTGANEASPCPQATSAPQAGQVRDIRRTDGVVIRRWYDAAGRTVAIRTGDPGELACWSFAADGSMLTAALLSTDGDVVEEMAVDNAAGGDPRVSRTTVRSRPLGAKELGEPAVTETRIDLLGRMVSYVDLTGVTFAYTYDIQGNQLSRTTTLDGKTLVISEQEFDRVTGRPTRMLIDGKAIADVSYDSVGRVKRVDYASGVAQSFRYRPNGTVDITAVELAGGGEATDRTSTNQAGRVFERLTEVSGLGALNTVRTWSYVYDGAARLKSATLDVSGDQAGVGAKSARFSYGFGPQDASCGQGGNPGADLNRTSGNRYGTDYVTCYDATARPVSTTDPLLAPEGGSAQMTWDSLGRLVSSTATGAELAIAWTWAGLPATVTDGLGRSPVTTELAHALGRLVAQRSTQEGDPASGVVTRMAYANPSALAPSVLLDDAGARQVRLLLPGGALWSKTLATGDVVVDHPGIRGEVFVRTNGTGEVAPGPGGGSLAETLGPFGEPVEVRRDSAGGIPADPPRYGFGFARLEPTLPGGTGLVLATARPYLPALGAYIAFDPDPGASTTGYGYAEADPVNYSDPTGAYSWWEFARNVLTVVSITAAAMTPGAQWYIVLAISLASSGGQLALTAAERDAQGLELTTTDWVFEGVSVAMDMAFMGSGKGVKSAWQSKKAVTESVDTVSEELTSSALRMSSQPANEAPSLFREAAKATLIVAGFQVVLGGGGSEENAAASGASGQEQSGVDPQDCPVEGGCEGMPSREGEHRGPDRL